MFAIQIDLLSGRYAATAYNDRDQVEWPPHPARLFAALVATWAAGEPGTPQRDAEVSALQWLEAQPPPAIVASPISSAGKRSTATVFVPVNDVGVIKHPDRTKLEAAERALAEAKDAPAQAKASKQLEVLRDKLRSDTAKETAVPAKFGKHDAASAEASLLDRRARQPRTFPCAVPEAPAFAFVWPESMPAPQVVAALSRLAQDLVRLGHSSSMVHARVVVDAAPALARTTRFVPDERDGELMIRWVGPGQTERLIRAHERHQAVEPRVLPARLVRYREGERAARAMIAHSVFDTEWVVLSRHAGPRLPITSVAGLSRQFRRALMSVADQPVSELLSGHRPDGAPSETPHAAIIPLPFVMGPHPDGQLLGIAISLPRAASEESRRSVTRALAALERHAESDQDVRGVRLDLGQADPLVLTRVVWGEDGRATLSPGSWTRASSRWASATPVALDRNPGDLHAPDPAERARSFEAARESVIASVVRIGLPAPIEVDVVRSCVLPGTAKPRMYPRFPSDGRKHQRVLVHVRLVFAEPVRGPVLIGAGRYHGMGLCMPVDSWRAGA